MSLIVAKNITKNFKLGKTTVNALRGINVDVKRGEYIIIAGPSGAGKSTFLNILGLLDRSTGGDLFINDQDISLLNNKELHRFRKKRISFIFQTFNLIPVLNAFENIEFPLLLQKVEKKEREKRIMDLVEAVNIKDYLKHRPDELSGGQRQRVAIARSLVTRPEIILADEPTANLDTVTGNNVLDILQRLNQEEQTTFIIASHDPIVWEKAKRRIKIVDGMIV